MKKLILLLTLSTTFICSSALSANTEPYYSIDATMLNVRQEPNSTSQIIGTLKKGTHVEIIEDTGLINKIDNIYATWLKIKFGTKAGYIFGGYVKQRIDDFDLDSLHIFKFQTYKSNLTSIKTDTKIYELPDTNSKVLSSIGFAETIESINIAYTATSVKNHILWYHVSFENQDGFISSSDIVTDAIERNGMIYGVNNYPDSLEEWMMPGHYFLQTNSEIIVLMPNSQRIIQRFQLPEISDFISLIKSERFDNTFGVNILIIHHQYNHSSTDVYGYAGNVVYRLNENGTIGPKIFSWLDWIGTSDHPYVSIKDIILNKESIDVKYNYFDTITELDSNKINLIIKYIVNNQKPVFSHIESKVIQTKHWVNTGKGYQTLEDLKRPTILHFSKKTLNSQFTGISKVYPLVYE